MTCTQNLTTDGAVALEIKIKKVKSTVLRHSGKDRARIGGPGNVPHLKTYIGRILGSLMHKYASSMFGFNFKST